MSTGFTANSSAAAPAGVIVPEMFYGPRRLQPLMPLLRRLPDAIARQIVVALAFGDGLSRSSRLGGAWAWAAAHRHGVSRFTLAMELLINHGRFVADEVMFGLTDPDRLRSTVIIQGAEQLTTLSSGALLLGFHLGPPRTSFVLRALGYPIRPTGRLGWAGEDERWRDAVKAGEIVRLPSGTPDGRADALNRIRNLLRRGELVYLPADGPFGRAAFRIPVPGGSMTVRMGWLAVRRLARVPTFPVQTYLEHGRRTIVVHPPLPEPISDSARDAEACQAALAPLVENYVRRFPAQCRYLAFPPWLGDTSTDG